MRLPEPLQAGTVLGERYRIVRQVGSGGTSRVYSADDLKLPGKIWAVKQSLASNDSYARMEEEALILIGLQHRKLPRVIDFFPPDPDGFTYLIMDFIEGITLDRFIRNQKSAISDEALLSLSEQICDGLEYLHTRQPPIIYRDLKPSNLMIEPGGELRFIDFGTARHQKEGLLEDTVMLGTIGFAAPEQYGGRQTDSRTDLYALGAIMLFMATGGRYSEWSQTLEAEDGSLHLSPDIRRLVQRLLQQRPEDRYSSAAEVRLALRAARSSLEGRRAGLSGISQARPYVLAVMGASPGAGSTHASITIAHSLSKHFANVTLLGWDQKSDCFDQLGLMKMQEYRTGGSFSIDRVKYCKRPSRAELLSLLGTGSGLVVLDLGSKADKEGLEEFLRADLQLVIAATAAWRRKELIACYRMLSAHKSEHRYYCLTAADDISLQSLRRELDGCIIRSFPFEPSPFHPSDGTVQEVEELCTKILAREEPVQRSFWKFLKKSITWE